MNLSLGVRTEVDAKRAARTRIGVSINGKPAKAGTTTLAVSNLLKESHLAADVEVRSICELPVSQGFGMSGAGALSAVFATARALDIRLTWHSLVAAAHRAEVKLGTGLGDIVAQATGGADIRVRPGLPPFGFVDRLRASGEVILCVAGEALLTKSVLAEPKMRASINKHGETMVRRLLADPTLEKLLELSYEFAVRSGLASGKVLDAIEDARRIGMASMSMLGSAVFAIGDSAKLRGLLARHGRVLVAEIEQEPVRLL